MNGESRKRFRTTYNILRGPKGRNRSDIYSEVIHTSRRQPVLSFPSWFPRLNELSDSSVGYEVFRVQSIYNRSEFIEGETNVLNDLYVYIFSFRDYGRE